ncbi:MAG: glycosyltransferase family 2 protein [Peptococcaceae bacterium]|nr:glycosyltransferase family 2 protein [Peptococcaceae bacterium]
MLSVVVPAYNEQGLVVVAAQTLREVLSGAGIDYEVIFVDDGSRDGTWNEIAEASERDDKVRGLRFSRNFGKESAIFAGLSAARGDCCAVIDCDLQHPPEKLVEMYALWQEGYEVVNGVKEDRGKESVAHGFAAKCFYKLMSRAARIDMSRSSDFKLMDRRVVDALLWLPERQTFFRALVGWVGFRSIDVPFCVEERAAGKSHFSTVALFRYALSNITAFSSAPLQIVTVIGCIFLVLAVVLSVQTLVHWARGMAADGFTTVIILLLFIGSVIMISLGIIGYYIAQIYIESKERPRYLVAQTCEAKGRSASGRENDTNAGRGC